jgi:type I restriction enzyme S subunit
MHAEAIKKPTPVKYLQKDDTVVNSTGVGTLGRVGIYRKTVKATVDSHVTIVRANKLLNSLYLFYNLFSRQDEIESIGEGSTGQTELSRHRLGDLLLKVPPISEQKAIAEVLSSIDDKIDLLNRQNETLEAMAQTLFRQWFIEEADDSWEEKRLEEILTAVGGGTPSTKNAEYWDGKYSWTTPKDITRLGGLFMFKTEKKLTSAGLKKVSSGLLPQGTLLMTSRAPVGVLAFSAIEVAINQGYIAIFDNKGVDKVFLYMLLKLNIDIVHGYSNGSTFMEISKKAFRSISVKMPPSSTIDNYVNLVKPKFEKIRSNEESINQLSALRDILLPKLMSGEVRVKLD